MKIFCEKGNQIINEKAYPVGSSTVLKRGQLVKLSNGEVAACSAGETGSVLGLCLENHPSSTGLYAGNVNHTVRVADGPALVYMCPAPEITVTSGTTTTVAATGLGSFANDTFNNGRLKLISKGASSTNGGAIGDVYKISDYVAADKAFTINTTLSGAPAAGDKYQVFPVIGTSVGVLGTDIASYALTTATDSFAFRVVGWDLKNGNVYLMANKHVYGNDK